MRLSARASAGALALATSLAWSAGTLPGAGGMHVEGAIMIIRN